MRLPQSPEEKRAKDAARQKRHRERVAARKAVNAAVDHSIGLGPKPSTPPPAGIAEADFNKMVRDRIATIFADMDDGAVMLKEFAPAIALGLKAQKALDEREKQKAKAGQTLELLSGLRAILRGELAPPPKQLEDGNTIEGEYIEVPSGAPE